MKKRNTGYEPGVAYIVYAADSRFAEILGVSLTSLLENSRDMDEIVVYILDSGISDMDRNKIERVCVSCGRSLVWAEAKDISRELGIHVKDDRGSLSQYARLFLSGVLPPQQRRVLYLDCDTIVNKSIKEIWNLNLQGKTVAALMDAFSVWYRKNIGLKKDEAMFNSGVMLIDLEKWRQKRIEEKLLKFIGDRKGRIQQGDQGALNAVLNHDVYYFAPKFNSVSIFYDFSYQDMLIYRKPPVFYTEEEIKQAVEEPAIIHFTTSFFSVRPWVEGCSHRYLDKWIAKKESGLWKENPLWEDSRPCWKKIFAGVYKSLPGRWKIYVVGILQAYMRPLANRLRYR